MMILAESYSSKTKYPCRYPFLSCKRVTYPRDFFTSIRMYPNDSANISSVCVSSGGSSMSALASLSVVHMSMNWLKLYKGLMSASLSLGSRIVAAPVVESASIIFFRASMNGYRDHLRASLSSSGIRKSCFLSCSYSSLLNSGRVALTVSDVVTMAGVTGSGFWLLLVGEPSFVASHLKIFIAIVSRYKHYASCAGKAGSVSNDFFLLPKVGWRDGF